MCTFYDKYYRNTTAILVDISAQNMYFGRICTDMKNELIITIHFLDWNYVNIALATTHFHQHVVDKTKRSMKEYLLHNFSIWNFFSKKNYAKLTNQFNN